MKTVEAEHGSVCTLGTDFYGYFGWPTVARLEDGTLLAAASGLRNDHVCPFGRSVICSSRDDGATWSEPAVVNDTPFDDRDTGLVCAGGRSVVLTWFTSDNRERIRGQMADENSERARRWLAGLIRADAADPSRYTGAWLRTSDDGGETWSEAVRIPVNAPHGPIRLADGGLLYLGKEFGMEGEVFRNGAGRILAMRSDDGGRTWNALGAVDCYEGTEPPNYHEAHVAELPDGTLVGHIRFQNFGGTSVKVEDLGLTSFSIMQTVSTDGGKTWSPPEPLGFHGSPPHLLAHSSGALVCVYGYRQKPFGERAAVSRDGGASWEHDIVLRDDGPDGDLGYPASVELDDGSIFTLYYQKEKAGDRCGLLWTRWRLPE